MARFAKLGLNSKVEEIHLVDDSIAINEKAGIEYLQKLFNNYPFWKQSFTDGTRKNPAGKGMIYDDDRDAFRAKKPYPSWILNEDTCHWEAPVAYPDDGKTYNWNEETTSWDLLE
jgi:hypothetical protein